MGNKKKAIETKSKLPPDGNLKEETQAVIDDHIEFLTAKIYFFEKAISIGHRLVKIKTLLPHGKFMSHCKEHFSKVGIGRTTINKYMSLAENELELREEFGKNIELKKAYQYLSSKSKKEKPTAIENTLMKAVESNEERKKELLEKRRLLNQVEKKLLKGQKVDDPEKTIARKTFEERREKARKQFEKYDSLVSQITT